MNKFDKSYYVSMIILSLFEMIMIPIFGLHSNPNIYLLIFLGCGGWFFMFVSTIVNFIKELLE